MSKNLTFKLILDGDSKGLVSAAKQSEDAARKALDAIKNGTADIVGSTSNATKSMDSFGDQTTQTAKQVQGLDGELDQTNQSLRSNHGAAQAAEKGINGLKTGYSMLASAIAAAGIGLSIRELAEAADSYTNLSTRIQIATKDGGDFTSAMAGVHQVALATNSSLDATGELFTRLNAVGKEMGMTQQQALDLTKTVTQAIQIGGGSAQASEAAVTQFIQAMQGGVLRGEEFNSIMENGFGLAEALAKGLGVTTGELRGMAEAGELSAERVVKAIGSQSAEIEKLYGQFPTTIGNALQRIATSWQILIGEMDQANGASATVAQWLVTLADNMGVVETLLNDIGEGFVWVGDQLKKIDPATIEALKEALATAYESVKDLGRTLGDSFERGVDIINTVLGTIFDFDSGVDAATDKTNGFTKALQALNVVFGFIGDGFKAINIVANLLTGVFYDVAAAWQNFKSKFTWGDTKTEIIAEMNAMAEKAQEYYTKASNGAMDFKSKGVEAIQEISKTQTEKNAESVADAKATMDQLLAEQSREVEGKKATESEKLAAVQAYAEAAIAANKGVIDGTMQADLINKGYIVTVDEVGKVSVEAWKKGEEATERQSNATDKARKAAKSLGLDLDVSLNRVSEKFKESENNVDSFVAGLEGLGVTGKQAGDVTYEAWQKWAEQAKNQAEIDAAKAKLIEFQEQGVFSAKQVEMGMRYLDEVNSKIPQNISEIEKAYKLLGITSREEANKMAEAQMRAFNLLQQSGKASVEELKQALINMADKIYASGDAAKIASYEAKLAYYGLSTAVNESGKTVVQSSDEATDAVYRMRDATGAAGDGFDRLREKGVKAGNDVADSWEEARQAVASGTDEFREGLKKQGDALSKALYDYNSYTKDDVIAAIKSKGYSDSEAKKLAASIWSQGLQADRDAKAQSLGRGGGALTALSNAEFDKAMKLGKTTQNGTNKINELLQNIQVASSGLGSYAPSTPGASSPASGQASKNVKYDIQFGGQTLSVYGDEGTEDTMSKLIKQLQGVAKST